MLHHRTLTVPDASFARMKLSFWLAAAAASAYLCRNCVVVAEKTIRLDLDITEGQMGLILGPAFFWSYALAQLPGGLLGKRFGNRWMIPLYIIVWSLGTACWGLAGGFVGLFAGRLMVGIAQAGIFPCSALTISRWYPATERARASAALAAAMQIGAAIAAFLTVILFRYWSWQQVFIGYSIPGLLIAVGFYRWFRDDPADHRSVSDDELQTIRGRHIEHRPDSVIRATPLSLTLLSCQQFFRAAAYIWFGSWFATYLQETRGVSQEKSGWLLAMVLMLAFASSLLSGTVSDLVFKKTGSLNMARRGVATTSLLICSALVFSAYFIEDATLATITIGAGVFFATMAGPCSYAAAIDMGGKNVAQVFAVMNMVGNFGAGLLPLIVPYYRKFIDQQPILLAWFGSNSWNAVLVLFGTMYVFAAICWMFLHLEPAHITKETSHE